MIAKPSGRWAWLSTLVVFHVFQPRADPLLQLAVLRRAQHALAGRGGSGGRGGQQEGEGGEAGSAPHATVLFHISAAGRLYRETR